MHERSSVLAWDEAVSSGSVKRQDAALLLHVKNMAYNQSFYRRIGLLGRTRSRSSVTLE